LIPELVATYNFWEIILVALTAMGLNFDEWKSGWLHEKHAVAAWKLATFLSLHTKYSCLTRNGSHRKHRIQQFFYCCLCIHCRGNVYTYSLPSNGRLSCLYYSCLLWGIHSKVNSWVTLYFSKIKYSRWLWVIDREGCLKKRPILKYCALIFLEWLKRTTKTSLRLQSPTGILIGYFQKALNHLYTRTYQILKRWKNH
jgi:hypothetical protein